jgi:hypothetical protein
VLQHGTRVHCATNSMGCRTTVKHFTAKSKRRDTSDAQDQLDFT